MALSKFIASVQAPAPVDNWAAAELLREYEQAQIRSEQEIWASPKRSRLERVVESIRNLFVQGKNK